MDEIVYGSGKSIRTATLTALDKLAKKFRSIGVIRSAALFMLRLGSQYPAALAKFIRVDVFFQEKNCFFFAFVITVQHHLTPFLNVSTTG